MKFQPPITGLSPLCNVFSNTYRQVTIFFIFFACFFTIITCTLWEFSHSPGPRNRKSFPFLSSYDRSTLRSAFQTALNSLILTQKLPYFAWITVIIALFKNMFFNRHFLRLIIPLKRASPGPFQAPSGSGTLVSVALITTLDTSRSGIH